MLRSRPLESIEERLISARNYSDRALLVTICVGDTVPVPDDQRRAIEAVIDPLLGRAIGQLSMVSSVEKGLLAGLKTTISFPCPTIPYLDELRRRITESIGERVTIETNVMDEDARTTMMTRLRDSAGPRVGQVGSATRVIAVSSGKGGVGKSSVTTNLAVAFSRMGRRVGVIDADIWGFSIPRMLGITDGPGGHRPVDHPADRLRDQGHVDGLLRARRQSGGLAGADAPQGDRTVPHRRLLGFPRVPDRRHAAGYRRYRHLDEPVPAHGLRFCSSLLRSPLPREWRGGLPSWPTRSIRR